MPPSAPQLRPLDPAPLAQPPAPAAADVVDLRALLRLLRRRLWVILAVALATFAAGAIRTLREQKLYTSQVSMVIELQAPKVLGDQVQDVAETQASFWQTKDFFETQFLFLKSKAVASRVVRRLQLDRDEAFLGLTGIADHDLRAQALKAADASAVLRSRVKVEPIRDSHVVRVLVEDTDPKRAALIANTMADEFIAFNLDDKLDTSNSATSKLQAQMDELRGKLQTSERDLFRYKRENEILTPSLEDSQSIVGKSLSQVSEALTAVRRERAALEAKVAQVKAAEEAGALSALPQVLASPVVQAHRTRVLALGEELADARTRYGEEHPKIIALQRRKAEIESLAAREEKRIAQAAVYELAMVQGTEKNLVKLLQGTMGQAFAINQHEDEFNRLRRARENDSKSVEMVLRRMTEVALSSATRTNNVRLLDPAEAPLAPSSPNLRFALLVSLALGLLFGIGMAVVVEQLDNTLKGQEDVERCTRAAFLGIIPEVRGESREQPTKGDEAVELFIHRQPQSSVAECLRTVRTNLLFLSTERPLQKLLVTSSGPQEGKTTAVVDLGITFAQSGQRVLLVDTDMRRPRLHKVFGFSNDLGLSSVLLDEKRLGEAIRTTVVPNVSVLVCGPIPPNPAELLHTERFRHVVAELCRRYDRVIFDSPPVSVVTDAQILAADVDGTVLLGKAGKTTKDALTRARRQLDAVEAHVVGTLLNGVDLADRSAGYYYDYYGRYGGYQSEEEPAAGGKKA
jgi:capsular exopolysaccharide synthesis family protein